MVRAASNSILYTGAVTLAAARAAGTVTEIDFATRSGWEATEFYGVVVLNLGASPLTVVLRNVETIEGQTYYPEVDRWTVSANAQIVLPVRAAWGLGEGSRISVSNDNTIATEYTVRLRVRQGA